MDRRKLGSTGLEVSEIGYGAWQLCNSDSWGGMDDQTALRLIDEAIDGGINLFDTAPNYADTKSERILGKALERRRDKVVLVSKFGHTPEGPKLFSVDWFWKSLEASLSRLRTDYLDVLLLHNPPSDFYAGTDPVWAAMDEAKAQGKSGTTEPASILRQRFGTACQIRIARCWKSFSMCFIRMSDIPLTRFGRTGPELLPRCRWTAVG